jgi:hypothetical protein
MKWLQLACVVHAGTAFTDGRSSWGQLESNPVLASGGRFDRTSASKMGLLTAAVIGTSYLVGRAVPRWRKSLAVLNFSMGGAHGAATVWNMRQRPR